MLSSFQRAFVTAGLLATAVFLPPALNAQRAIYRRNGPAVLPDAKVTPGLVRTTDTQAVCHGGSTKQFRKTTEAMKDEVYRAYGAKRGQGLCAKGCEVDHLISLELGGADDVKNLWPQPYEPRPGAHEKDAVEDWLHRQVCSGAIKLADAQKQISSDWYAVYLKMPRKRGRK